SLATQPVRANQPPCLKGHPTMITALSSPKPGSGTTTTAALLALAICHDTHTHLVDLAGDQPTALGTHNHPGTLRITEQLTLHDLSNLDTAAQIATIRALVNSDDHIVIDAGPADHPVLEQLPI